MDNSKDIVENAVEWYISNEMIYRNLAKKIENIISEIFNATNVNYHIITSRCKEIESFRKKISSDKYDDPINQITDLAGIRIITYVEDELKTVCKLIEETFDIDKDKSLDKSKELGIDKVGYKSIHYIASLKENRLQLPEYKIFENKVFEIQIRTILQHAWAEIEHDRNYKFSGKLPDEISRRFKLLAGSLEMNDREFNNISRDIDIVAKEIEKGTKKGELDFEINSTSIKQFIETKFLELEKSGIEIGPKLNVKVIEELKNYGLSTLHDLDMIIPRDLIKVLIDNKEDIKGTIQVTGLVRLILMLNDADKYFSKSWNNNWSFWSNTRKYDEIFEHYKIDKEKIKEKYDVKL